MKTKIFPSAPGLPTLLALLLCLGLGSSAFAQYTLSTSSYLGDGGSTDKVFGSRIQSDGTIVLAANIGSATPGGKTAVLLNGATSSSSGAIIRLAADGRTVLSVTRVAAQVLDLAIDGSDNIYVAAATGGVLKLNATASILSWARLAGIHIHRVDAGPGGYSVALKPSSITTADENAGTGTVYVFQANGTEVANFAGHRNTQDVAIDEASQTVIHIGWRQANAFDGSSTQPVQIAYIRGRSYTGTIKWTDYDWSTDPASADFINKPENNMADTRGYRCSLGADGKLYAAFEAAGGNHIFRYSPTSITTKVSIVGGDKYHNFYNTKSEHKTFFGRYEPATGAYLKGQQLVNRLSDGSGNTIRTRGGEIRADAQGRVYIGGSSAAGLPMTYDPLPAGSYNGGAWFMVMSSDFITRLYVTRVSTAGETSAIDARVLSGTAANIVWGGRVPSTALQYTSNALQPAAGGGTQDGFFAVIKATSTTTPPGTVALTPTADALVRDGTYAGTNYGTALELVTKKAATSNSSYGRESYLKFDLTSVSGTISSAKIRLYGNLNDANGTNVATAVYPVAITSWTEAGLTWTNKPAAGTTALATTSVVNNTASWYEWDVTGFIEAEKAAGRNTVSLALKNPAASTPYTTFASREAATNKPQLVITTTGSARTVSPGPTEAAAAGAVSVFPNPAREQVRVTFGVQLAQPVPLTLSNSTGGPVWQTVHEAHPGENRVTVPTRHLRKGVYLLTVVKDGRRTVQKVVITD